MTDELLREADREAERLTKIRQHTAAVMVDKLADRIREVTAENVKLRAAIQHAGTALWGQPDAKCAAAETEFVKLWAELGFEPKAGGGT